MGHELRSLCQVEAKTLIWLIVLVFASALAVQYFELPYGGAIRSIFAAGRPQVGLDTSSNGNASGEPKVFGDTTYFDVLSSNDTVNDHSYIHTSGSSEGMNIGLKNDSVSERNEPSDDSLNFDDNHSDSEDEYPSKDFIQVVNNSTVDKSVPVNALPPQEFDKSAYGSSPNNFATGNNSSLDRVQEEGSGFTGEKNGSKEASPANPPFASPPRTSTPNINSVGNVNITQNPLSFYPKTSSVEKNIDSTIQNDKKSSDLRIDNFQSQNSSLTNGVPALKKRPDGETKVVSISEMNELLFQSRASSFSMKPRWSSAVDKELLNAKSQVENAPISKNDHGLYAPLYRNVSMFKRSYELMEQRLKVYIYKEGERPIFHTPVLKGIYASEGWFMKLLKASKHFVTKNPRKAHLFYLPFSSRMLEETLYVPNSHNHKNLIACLKNYLDTIVARYSFWNRTGGADHFLVACHDWAPSETRLPMASCIRALCNSDIKEGFKFGKDVSLPETYVRSAQNPLRELGGKPPSQRNILAFFAGNMHGYLRPILLQHWENKDPDMKIFGRMPKVKGNKNYIQHMKSSRYCICAKGYEVNSPRVVEAIFYECVPVIISDDFVPPFFNILNWESFAVFVSEKDIPDLKNKLLSIPLKRYLEMYKGVKKVQEHFLWHPRPVKYDIFHMTLHSVWYNRVFQMRPE